MFSPIFWRNPIASKKCILRCFTSGSIQNKISLSKGKLLRNFLDDFLYSETDGYFNTYDCIGKSTLSTNFNEMEDQTAYMSYQDECYQSTSDGWLTPVELFNPFYAETILAWMISENNRRKNSSIKYTKDEVNQNPFGKPNEPFHIIEIGAGTGTCCISILDAIRSKNIDFYNSENFSYTIVERSAAYAEVQRIQLARHGHSNKCDIYNMSITEWRDPKFQQTPCFVFGLEVLDNMPHDKIVTDQYGSFQQTSVHMNSGFPETHSKRPYIETYQPLEDGWISLYLDLVDDMSNPTTETRKQTFKERYKSLQKIAHGLLTQIMPLEPSVEKQIIFAPTTSLQFLNVLFKFFPLHSLLLVDFDFLPDVRIKGQNAPLVATKSTRTGGQTRDLNSYLVDLGVADVMFPTNFNALAHMYHGLADRYRNEEAQKVNDGDNSGSYLTDTRILKSGKFLQEFASSSILRKTTTKSGYNPMLQDYENQSVLIGTTH